MWQVGSSSLIKDLEARSPELEVLLLLLLLRHFSRGQLCVTLWIVAHQAPLSMGFSRQGYWSGLPCPPPGDLPDPGIEPVSPALLADSLPTESSGKRPPPTAPASTPNK